LKTITGCLKSGLDESFMLPSQTTKQNRDVIHFAAVKDRSTGRRNDGTTPALGIRCGWRQDINVETPST